MEILLVDDSQSDLFLHRRTFERAKILNSITTATAAGEAIERLRATDESTSAGRLLVFIDLIMVPMDGLELLQQIRAERLASDSVFVMLSGLSDARLLKQAYELGAHTFLTKPLDPVALLDLLRSLRRIIAINESTEGFVLMWLGEGGESD